MAKHTTRRAVLKAAPAIMVAPVATLATESESEIMRKFWACVAFKKEIDAPDSTYDGDDPDEAGTKLSEMEERMCAIPATTAQELAAKICVWTDYCEDTSVILLYNIDPLIIADVRKLIGSARA